MIVEILGKINFQFAFVNLQHSEIPPLVDAKLQKHKSAEKYVISTSKPIAGIIYTSFIYEETTFVRTSIFLTFSEILAEIFLMFS